MLTVAGLHVPGIPSFDLAGRTGADAPVQMAGIAVNAGITCGSMVIIKVPVVAHCPASGVKV